jgi:predicted MPP superfamily phosphohydrolase
MGKPPRRLDAQMTGSRFALFLTTALSIWGLVHLYVFWRLASVPWIVEYLPRKVLVWAGVFLWLSYVLARLAGGLNWPVIAFSLEFAASVWMGLVFLMFVALMGVDVVTLGGAVFARHAASVRGWAVVAAVVLGGVALVQGMRAPVVTRHEVRLAGLPAERDGLRLVAISDLHLGRLLGERWLTQRVAQVNGLEPDCLVAVGDVVDGSAHHLEPLVPILRGLRAPLGVWSVTGNHEFYEGLEHSIGILHAAGWRVLRDQSVEVVPGLVLVGVDDLTARQQFGKSGDPLAAAFQDVPAGSVVFLSHSPMEASRAAALGAGLMLSGHTHGGQIWPFNHLVALKYPLVAGRYEVDGMAVLVGRGTGTWGPPMRLWRRSEILEIILRTPLYSGSGRF